jgi:hypothetical protein
MTREAMHHENHPSMYLHGFQHKLSVRETKKYILHTILNEMIRDLTAPSTKAKQTVFLHHKIKNFPCISAKKRRIHELDAAQDN